MGALHGFQILLQKVPNNHFHMILTPDNILHSDFSGSGHPDILWRNTATGELTLWYLDGIDRINSRRLSPYAALQVVMGTARVRRQSFTTLRRPACAASGPHCAPRCARTRTVS